MSSLIIVRDWHIYIEDIYFLEVNTKYMSSNVLKISAFSRMRSTSEIDNIFKHEMKYVWYLPKKKKSKFSFYFILFRTITESRPSQ